MNGHEEHERLLPWLVNGTLAGEERRELEAHLEGCAACREELERCRALATELALVEGAAPMPHPAQFARLVERIRAGEYDRAEPGADAPRRPLRAPRAWRATPRPVRWLLAAQAAGLLVALSLLGAPREGVGAPRFRTLSSAAAPAARAAVRVVFAPDATEAGIRRLLLEARAEIVGGPSALGAYALALAPAAAGESAASVVERLRDDPLVRLAEPIAAPQAAAGAPTPTVPDVAPR